MRNLLDDPVLLIVLVGFLVLVVIGVLLLVWAVRRGVSSGIRDAERRSGGPAAGRPVDGGPTTGS